MYSAYVEFSKPINSYCEARSYNFGMGSSPIAGGATGKAQLHDFQFTKDIDSLSPSLFQHVCAGTVFGTVWFEIYRNDEEDPYVTYTMSNVVISSLHTAGNVEHVGLNFKAMIADYAGR